MGADRNWQRPAAVLARSGHRILGFATQQRQHDGQARFYLTRWSACASTKSIPCFFLFEADLAGSNSNSILVHEDIPNPTGDFSSTLNSKGPPALSF